MEFIVFEKYSFILVYFLIQTFFQVSVAAFTSFVTGSLNNRPRWAFI